MDLYKVSIGLKTFLRDQKLLNAIRGILDTMPEVTIIVADCGNDSPEKQKVYNEITKDGHSVIHLPYDSGFGAMSNTIVEALDTEFLLIGSDDFSFSPSSVRTGIEKMLNVLETTDVDIASGRVRGPYEFDLEDLGDTIIEHRVNISQPYLWFHEVDLTVNYSLVKRRVFEKVRWDNDVKIGGGEHGAFFVDAKRAGFKTALVSGAQISEQEGQDSEEYNKYRRRSASPERPCFKKRGIKKYVLGSGQIDYLEKEILDYPEPITR